MKAFVTLSAVLSLIAICSAETGLVSFELRGGQTLLTMELDPGESKSVNVNYNGSVLAEVTFDEVTLRPTGFTFLAGSVSLDHAPVSVSAVVNYTGVGERFTTISLSSSGVVMFPSTFPSPGPFVDGTNEMLQGSQTLTANQGVISLGLNIGGVTEQLNEDYSLFPSQSEGLSMTLDISEVSSGPLRRKLLFALGASLDEAESEVIDGTQTRLSLSEKGSMVATGTLELLGYFAQWAVEQGLDVESLGEVNPYGLNYQLLYALNLPVDSRRLPLLIFHDSDRNVVEIELPEDGAQLKLIPQYTLNLVSNSWENLPVESFIDGIESLDVGAVGTVRLALPAEESVFFRFAVDVGSL